MEQEIEDFLTYMAENRQASKNTIESYSRDLSKLSTYMKENGKTDAREILPTNLTSYVLYMERTGLSSATISRSIASIRAFFLFLLRRGRIAADPAEQLRPPRIEKKPPTAIPEDVFQRLLMAPDTATLKGARDQTMLCLMSAAGIRVSELIELTLKDVHLEHNYICCHTEERERALSIDHKTRERLHQYIQNIRPELAKEHDYLFTNYRGGKLSRQGVWKMIKQYAAQVGIEQTITPQMLRKMKD